jgi:uncharacterized protein involved in exopolysaccharide biosynthesis
MAQRELSLSDYWHILRKRVWEIMATVVLFLAATSLYLQRQTPIYEAEAKIKLERPAVSAEQLLGGPGYYYEDSMVTETRFIESTMIAKQVTERLIQDEPVKSLA